MTKADSKKQKVIEYFDQEAANYISLYRKDRMDQEFYPANHVRLELIIKRLAELKCRTVLDLGCGSGGTLCRFIEEGFDPVGVDFSQGMVDAAKAVLAEQGFEPSIVHRGDLEDRQTLPRNQFDAVVAAGVFPHNLNDDAAYRNLYDLLAPEGVAMIEYRNALMALFSLNEYSEPFFWHDLLDADNLPEPLKEETRKFLARTFQTPVKGVGASRKINYTDILARFHNPLTLADEIKPFGLELANLHYYHFHCAPPHLEKKHKGSFWQASLAMEKADDWRGMFMASAFVAEIIKTPV